jgi:hypothetical protein
MQCALHSYYMVERTRMLNVRVADIEMTMLQQLAEETGLSVSDVVRQLIRKTHSEAGLARAKPRPKKIRTKRGTRRGSHRAPGRTPERDEST